MTARQRIHYAIKRLERKKGWCRTEMRKSGGKYIPSMTVKELDAAPGCLVGSMMTAKEVQLYYCNTRSVPNLHNALERLGFADFIDAFNFNDKSRTKAPVLRRLRAALTVTRKAS